MAVHATVGDVVSPSHFEHVICDPDSRPAASDDRSGRTMSSTAKSDPSMFEHGDGRHR
jgi:hypothetical protein